MLEFRAALPQVVSEGEVETDHLLEALALLLRVGATHRNPGHSAPGAHVEHQAHEPDDIALEGLLGLLLCGKRIRLREPSEEQSLLQQPSEQRIRLLLLLLV